MSVPILLLILLALNAIGFYVLIDNFNGLCDLMKETFETLGRREKLINEILTTMAHDMDANHLEIKRLVGHKKPGRPKKNIDRGSV